MIQTLFENKLLPVVNIQNGGCIKDGVKSVFIFDENSKSRNNFINKNRHFNVYAILKFWKKNCFIKVLLRTNFFSPPSWILSHYFEF
jgi:hypothetical protein